MIPFTKVLREIDAELKPEWQTGAFVWADQKMGGIHNKAVLRFERAIKACGPRCDWSSLKIESEVYRDAILEILRAYKRAKGIDDRASFLDSLRSQ